VLLTGIRQVHPGQNGSEPSTSNRTTASIWTLRVVARVAARDGVGGAPMSSLDLELGSSTRRVVCTKMKWATCGSI
jgi:hypothetical protein